MIHGGATRAALELNITQSSVSRILKEFEKSIGFRLFDRERSGLRPTREAEQLFKDVRRAYATFTEVKQTAQSILNNGEGHLRVAALAVYVDGFISRCITGFMAKYPGISIQLIAASKPEIEKLVATEQMDFGIYNLPTISELTTIRHTIKRSAVVISPKEHSLSKQKKITISDLIGHKLIFQNTGAPLRSLMDTKFLEQGLEPTVRVEMESQRAVVNIVSAGGGIGVIDPDILSDQDRDQICSRPLTPNLEWSLAVVSAKRASLSQIEDAFLGWMYDLKF
jgi:DNA-binding transcriptional LysR family regulator